MADPLHYPTGAPVWAELHSHDTEAAEAFYTSLFGWTAQRMGAEYGGYVTFFLDGKLVGGMMPNARDEGTDFWNVYLESDDVATTATAVRDAEGDVIMGPQQVMTLGSMLLANDVDGAPVGAWQRGDNTGFEVLATPGAPGWFELHTTKYDDEVRFYQRAFGWETATMADDPGFRYTQLMVDGQPYAGVMDASAYWQVGAPAAWVIYYVVDDTDATIARVIELGGAQVEPPEDTPFGRLAGATDPTGAYFKLIQNQPGAA